MPRPNGSNPRKNCGSFRPESRVSTRSPAPARVAHRTRSMTSGNGYRTLPSRRRSSRQQKWSKSDSAASRNLISAKPQGNHGSANTKIQQRFKRLPCLPSRAQGTDRRHESPRTGEPQDQATGRCRRPSCSPSDRWPSCPYPPNDEAILRLIGTLMPKTNDEWAVARRYRSLETPARITDTPTAKLPPWPPD